MQETPQTWHYGLIARWWAEFQETGPEIDHFRRFIEDGGEPALDVGCGTGRLLLPYLQSGLDVDGCDVSSDMITLCREKAERLGLSPTLFVQAMHALSPPRKYRTIFVCGAFGLGSTRGQDLQSLARFYEHLEPSGTLVMDNEVPYADADLWRYWPKAARASLPESLEQPGGRRRGSDQAEYSLRSRIVDLDPLNQHLKLEMRAEMWRDGVLSATEDRTVDINMYFKDELVLMLERIGFTDVRVTGGYADEEPGPDHDFLVFTSTKR